MVGGRSVGYAGQGPDPNDSNSPAEVTPLTNPDSNSVGSSNASPGFPELFFKMMGSIALVIGLGVAVLYLSKKVLPKVARGSAKEIRVVETVYLGPRKALHLVEVGHHRLLIGSTQENISPLATVSDAWLDLSKPSADDMVNA
jgi:flagellar biosynthetic protein FliO